MAARVCRRGAARGRDRGDVVFTRPTKHDQTALELARSGAVTIVPGVVRTAPSDSAAKALVVPAAKTRVQTYDATLSLRVEHARDVSDGVKRALQIATSLGGYSASVRAETHGSRAVADLKLKIPRAHVQQAMAKLSQLGTITDENVSTVDKTALLNATDREIARLQKQLATLRAQPQSPENDRRIVALVTRIERLQRGEATTRRTAHYATVDLHLETPLVTIAAEARARPAPRRGRRLDLARDRRGLRARASARRSPCCSHCSGSLSARCGRRRENALLEV